MKVTVTIREKVTLEVRELAGVDDVVRRDRTVDDKTSPRPSRRRAEGQGVSPYGGISTGVHFALRLLTRIVMRQLGAPPMAEIEAGTGLPEIAAELDGNNPICDECHHPAVIQPRRASVFRALFGMKPRPAECQVREYDPSGLSPLPCGCRNAAHGS
jgi:hypothetical protein